MQVNTGGKDRVLLQDVQGWCKPGQLTAYVTRLLRNDPRMLKFALYIINAYQAHGLLGRWQNHIIGLLGTTKGSVKIHSQAVGLSDAVLTPLVDERCVDRRSEN